MSSAESLSARWVYVALGAYAVGLLLFWPRVLLIVDEERYVSQAMAFAGDASLAPNAAGTSSRGSRMLSDYPPGTSLVQAPFIRVLGWRGAFAASLLALIVATVATMEWLKRSGANAAFALLVPVFPGTSWYARTAMSDVPGAAVVAVTCWLVWRARERHLVVSIAAGFSGGLSLIFREPLIVLLGPILVGAAVRRQAHIRGLTAGFAAAVLLRMILMEALFDSPWYVRDGGFGFSLSSLRHSLPVYGLLLTVAFPAAIALPIWYRGKRRPELVAAVVLYLTMFLQYEYDAVRHNGVAKGIVLTARFLVPLAPILAFMAADVWPRWFAALGGHRDLRMVTMIAATTAIAGSVVVHPLSWAQETGPLSIVRAMSSHTTESTPVVTNTNVTRKYLSSVYGYRSLIERHGVTADSLAVHRRRAESLTIVLMDRFDSDVFRAESEENASFLAATSRRCALTQRYDEIPWNGVRLRIFDVVACP